MLPSTRNAIRSRTKLHHQILKNKKIGKQRSVNPQTNKGLVPPHMVTKGKTYIFNFQP